MGRPWPTYAYTLDGVGNRLRLDEADGAVTTWEYDDVYRLVREQRQGGAEAPASESWDIRFTYDAVGNRQTMSELHNGVESITRYSYKPNQLDQLDRITFPDGSFQSFAYDPRGNLQSDGIATYTYDAADRLIGANMGSSIVQFQYDAEGRRLSQTVNGVTTGYLWDEDSAYGDVLTVLGNDGTPSTRYVLGENGVLGQVENGALLTLLTDGQGSTRAVADGSGNVTQRYLYDAFGNLRNAPGALQTQYLYTGQQFDQATGLYNLRARFYQPASGRFLNRDTFQPALTNPAELNRYAYVANNPVNTVDPTGYMAMLEYTANSQDEEQRAKDHAAYVNGYVRSRGPDTMALFQQVVFSAVVDKVIIEGVNAILPPFAKGVFTLGLGTIYHLKTNGQTKAFAVSANNWDAAGRIAGLSQYFPVGGLLGWLGSYTAQIGGPGITIAFILNYNGNGNPFDWWFQQNTMADHAEMIIARWSLHHYGDYPTPHRVLDIASTNAACINNGALSCNLQLPQLKVLQPLLFEMTIFADMRF